MLAGCKFWDLQCKFHVSDWSVEFAVLGSFLLGSLFGQIDVFSLWTIQSRALCFSKKSAVSVVR